LLAIVRILGQPQSLQLVASILEVLSFGVGGGVDDSLNRGLLFFALCNELLNLAPPANDPAPPATSTKPPPYTRNALPWAESAELADLRTLNRDDMYVYNIEKRLAKLLSLCGWTKLGDITADSFCRWRETPIEQGCSGSPVPGCKVANAKPPW